MHQASHHSTPLKQGLPRFGLQHLKVLQEHAAGTLRGLSKNLQPISFQFTEHLWRRPEAKRATTGACTPRDPKMSELSMAKSLLWQSSMFPSCLSLEPSTISINAIASMSRLQMTLEHNWAKKHVELQWLPSGVTNCSGAGIWAKIHEAVTRNVALHYGRGAQSLSAT